MKHNVLAVLAPQPVAGIAFGGILAQGFMVQVPVARFSQGSCPAPKPWSLFFCMPGLSAWSFCGFGCSSSQLQI